MTADDRTQIIGPIVPSGTVLNGIYQVERRISSGGMGRVHRPLADINCRVEAPFARLE